MVDFYVSGCSSVNFGPILDFKVSVDSLDPRDFKNGLKLAKQGHRKAVEPSKKRTDF